MPGTHLRRRIGISSRLACGRSALSYWARVMFHAHCEYGERRDADRIRSLTTMEKRNWAGVFAAITTPFHADFSGDHTALTEHVTWLIENGCVGIVALGSLGESP